MVNGADPTSTYRSITDAVTAAPPGTTIDIIGMEDGGLPVGYSQDAFFPGQPGELFPIQVPPGVTIRQMGNTPVYIWDSRGILVNLFELEPSGSLAPVRFRNLNFTGGDAAIEANQAGSGIQADLIIRDCRFSSSRTAVRAIARNGSVIQVGALDCTLTDELVTAASFSPVPRAQRFGFEFAAYDDGGVLAPCTVVGEIRELTVSGIFASMDPQPTTFVYDQPVDTTRVIDVIAVGGGGTATARQFPGAPASYVPFEIPEVRLNILGGNWNGAAAGAAAGWGAAIHAKANGGNPDSQTDFFAGYRINVTGTQMTSFREDGIFCGSSLNTRGHLEMNGQASVTRTGFTEPFSERRFSGVHLYSRESYTGFTSSACEFSANQGNGVYLNTDGDFAFTTEDFRFIVPTGIFIGLAKANVHNNDGNGIYLRNEPLQPSGFIGGTFHQTSTPFGALFTIDDDTRDFSYTDGEGIPNGQGLINRTNISNNGLAGVRIVARGSTGVFVGKPDSAPSGVAVRISNDFIWNNPLGGLSAEWRVRPGFTDLTDKGYYLVPVVHTTMAANGGALFPFTMEIDDRNGATVFDRATYEWTDPGPLPDPLFFRTNIWNTVLVRAPDFSLGVELGPVLNLTPFNSVVDDGSVVIGPTQVGFAGVRGAGSIVLFPSIPLIDTNSRQAVVPFLGLGNFVLSSILSGQFKLANSVADEIIDSTPPYFRVIGPETAVDHGGQTRPLEDSGVRDKGADEVDQ